MTESSPVNVAAHLPLMAARQPDAPAVILQRGIGGYAIHSFKDLNDESDRLAAGLDKIGVARGARTVLMVKPSMERMTTNAESNFPSKTTGSQIGSPNIKTVALVTAIPIKL